MSRSSAALYLLVSLLVCARILCSVEFSSWGTFCAWAVHLCPLKVTKALF